MLDFRIIIILPVSWETLSPRAQAGSAPRTAPTQHRSFLYSWIFSALFSCLPTATLHSGVHDAQTGDGRMPEEVQRQEETQGALNGKKDTHTRIKCCSFSLRRKCIANAKICSLPPCPSKRSFRPCTCDPAGFHRSWRDLLSPPFRLSNQCRCCSWFIHAATTLCATFSASCRRGRKGGREEGETLGKLCSLVQSVNWFC